MSTAVTGTSVHRKHKGHLASSWVAFCVLCGSWAALNGLVLNNKLTKTVINQSNDALPPQTIGVSNQTMSACLLVMEDTIKLTEWIAYHYTVLPLSNLVVAIDPHSQHPDRIIQVLERWNHILNITIWRTDEEWMEIGPNEYWPQNDPNPQQGRRIKEHRRRQRTFVYSCMRHLKKQRLQERPKSDDDDQWVLLTDTDEFLLFNYLHPQSENNSHYDTLGRGHWRLQIDAEREKARPLREALPSLETQPTIAAFLHQYLPHTRCHHIPGLVFSSYESANIGANTTHLMTLRHRKHTKQRTGIFSKAMINLRYLAAPEYIKMDKVKSIHNPNTMLCGTNGHSGSGMDYIASYFRLQHYIGTEQAYLERSGDVRRTHQTADDFAEKNRKAAGDESEVEDDDDIRQWMETFVNNVGSSQASRLLLDPLEDIYSRKS